MKSLLFTIFIMTACIPKSKDPDQSSAIAQCEASLMDGNGICQNAKAKAAASETKDFSKTLGDLPSLDKASLDTRFNKNKAQVEGVDSAYKDKMFKLQRIPFYRSIWLDIRVNNWKNLDKFEAGLNEVDPINLMTSIFKSPPKEVIPYMSIHQVLAKAGEANLEFQERFQVIGHTATDSLGSPSAPTAAIALIGSDGSAMTPPDGYDLIHAFEGPNDETAGEAACHHVEEDERVRHVFPDPIFEDICTFYRAENQAQLHTVIGQNFKSEALFLKKNVAIWRPIPMAGYQCLGDLATNGKLNQPYLNIDAVGSVAKNVNMYSENLKESLDYASYCIKEIYLSPGKLGRPIAYSPSQNIVMWTVMPADKDGYDGANLFVTFNLKKKPIGEQIKNMKFWVLNKKFLYVLEDLPPSRQSSTPSKK